MINYNYSTFRENQISPKSQIIRSNNVMIRQQHQFMRRAKGEEFYCGAKFDTILPSVSVLPMPPVQWTDRSQSTPSSPTPSQIITTNSTSSAAATTKSIDIGSLFGKLTTHQPQSPPSEKNIIKKDNNTVNNNNNKSGNGIVKTPLSVTKSASYPGERLLTDYYIDHQMKNNSVRRKLNFNNYSASSSNNSKSIPSSNNNNNSKNKVSSKFHQNQKMENGTKNGKKNHHPKNQHQVVVNKKEEGTATAEEKTIVTSNNNTITVSNISVKGTERERKISQGLLDILKCNKVVPQKHNAYEENKKKEEEEEKKKEAERKKRNEMQKEVKAIKSYSPAIFSPTKLQYNFPINSINSPSKNCKDITDNLKFLLKVHA